MSSIEAFEPSAVAAIQELRTRYPDTPFLTLGQTVFWDEPVKAAFCRILEAVAPDATMVAAVHDTDYFAKLGVLGGRDTEQHDAERHDAERHDAERHDAERHDAEALSEQAPGTAVPEVGAGASTNGKGAEDSTDEKFIMLPHNDGSTRGLWSAAGELSCLFGSETVPTRQALTHNGIAFDRVAKLYPGGASALLDEQTEAWGWRALVHTEPHPLIAADVKLGDIAPALRHQLEWGFAESLRFPQFAGEDQRNQSAALAAQVAGWIDEYIEFNEEGTLSDLYRALTPRLWALVRGGGSCNLQTGVSMELFRFNRATAKHPRFGFVDLFLQPATREIARRCYDDAVRGSGIYQLSQFGEGALPFDVVIRGRGRGTLRLHEGSLYIETEEPITLCSGCDCGSVEELAGVLEDRFGDGVALVGKAVALISMLAAEFIFVFHEKASSYTTRTQEMNDKIREAGIALPLHPMLRLKYSTWNALEDVSTTLRLPAHLASAFGAEEVPATEFAARWLEVCDGADATREALKACHAPRDLMQHLAQATAQAGRTPTDWAAKLESYDRAREVITRVREASSILAAQSEAAHEAARATTRQALEIERAKGQDWRENVQPLRKRLSDIRENAATRLAATGKLTKEERAARVETEADEEREIAELRASIEDRIAARARFDIQIEECRTQAAEAKATAKRLTEQRVATERSEEAMASREAIARIEYEAELERLLRTRDALITSQSLRYTDYRPTAWWFPLVSPDGAWFNGLVRTAQARIEAL